MAYVSYYKGHKDIFWLYTDNIDTLDRSVPPTKRHIRTQWAN